ncbi:unnamed protein product [Oikopleura dioica]|uniref:Uncharacterized protein n=1 Tax=Oikopleura dioica TaxID=34765 RepID=E4Y0Y1_OIKDI|nr:unnamed protein product [Oikopleura dioica]
MLTEFCFLAALTLNEDERAVLRNEIDEWVKYFLPKLERESTRTEKCRLIASVERQEFGYFWNARRWRFCKFVGKNGIIFNEDKEELEKFKITSLQKKILRRNPSLENVFIGRSDIMEENGFWKLNDELKNKIISEGGEAIIFLEKFGNLEGAVRIHIFDAFLLTSNFGANELKWKTNLISVSGSPGFSTQFQLTGNYGSEENYFYFLFCDWKTSWSLLYRPIDENDIKKIDKIIQKCNIRNIHKESHVIKNIAKIISLPNVSNTFSLDDPNLTKSCQMSNLKQQMTKCVNLDIKNLTKNILDQKWSNLCVPISVTTLLRFSIKNDLAFDDKYDYFKFEKILTILTMIVYPRSLAGLNLNPKKEENNFQMNDIETMLERICKKTYLKESGWEIVRKQEWSEPAESTCEFKKVMLNENFVFSRPLSVTGAYFLPTRRIDGIDFAEEVFFHQMTLDRIENGEYVLQNTQFSVNHPPVIKIKQTRPYYDSSSFVTNLFNQTGDNFYDDGVLKMKLVNETLFIKSKLLFFKYQISSLKTQ